MSKKDDPRVKLLVEHTMAIDAVAASTVFINHVINGPAPTSEEEADTLRELARDFLRAQKDIYRRRDDLERRVIRAFNKDRHAKIWEWSRYRAPCTRLEDVYSLLRHVENLLDHKAPWAELQQAVSNLKSKADFIFCLAEDAARPRPVIRSDE